MFDVPWKFFAYTDCPGKKQVLDTQSGKVGKTQLHF